MTGPTTYEQLSILNAAYAACIDEDQLEAWPDLFTDDCLYMVTTADNYKQGLPAGLIYADSKGMLRDRVSALREANVYERQRYRHVIGTSRVTGEQSAETPFLVVRTMRGGKMDLFAAGKYIDTFAARGDGALALSRRVVVCDSVSIDTLLAIPL